MKKDYTVIGSYPTEKEAESVVKRLLSEGNKKEDITIFTNREKSEHLHNPKDVEVASPDVNGTDEDGDNDKSFWESLKDAFTVRDDDYYEDPNYLVEDDTLHMYRDDLKKGYIVVAVTNAEGDQPAGQSSATSSEHVKADDPELDTLGTTAGFPDEGSVQGMGDGGQVPTDPKTTDGTPPELEDTHGEANPDDSTDSRMRQTRKEKLDD